MNDLDTKSNEQKNYTYVFPIDSDDAQKVKECEEAGLLDLPTDLLESANTLYDLCAVFKSVIEDIAARAKVLNRHVNAELESRQAATGDDSDAFAHAFFSVNPSGAAVEAVFYLGRLLEEVFEGGTSEQLPPWPQYLPAGKPNPQELEP